MQFNRRQFITGLTCSVLAFPSIAKAKDIEVFSQTRFYMGTVLTIKAAHHSQDFVAEAFSRAFDIVKTSEDILTRHKTSALSLLNEQKYLRNAPNDLISVAHSAQKFEKLTKGAFNPSVLSVLKYLESHNNVSKPELMELVSLIKPNSMKIEGNNISLAQNDLNISFDGIAKGYIVDKAYESLEKSGLTDFIITAGGDMRAKGMKSNSLLNPKPWKIAIEDPYKSRNYPAILNLNNAALATSGSYEKNFDQNFNHLIIPNAENGQISSQVLSVSVLAKTTIEADALATALSCMKIENALKLIETVPNTACFIVSKEQNYKSKNWV